MTPSDELKQASETALYKYTAGGTPYEEEHFKQGFVAGAAYQDPIARREERERVLRLLRGAGRLMSFSKDADVWADWLEEKLE